MKLRDLLAFPMKTQVRDGTMFYQCESCGMIANFESYLIKTGKCCGKKNK